MRQPSIVISPLLGPRTDCAARAPPMAGPLLRNTRQDPAKGPATRHVQPARFFEAGYRRPLRPGARRVWVRPHREHDQPCSPDEAFTRSIRGRRREAHPGQPWTRPWTMPRFPVTGMDSGSRVTRPLIKTRFPVTGMDYRTAAASSSTTGWSSGRRTWTSISPEAVRTRAPTRPPSNPRTTTR